MPHNSRNQATLVEDTIHRLIDEGREIGVQVCAYLRGKVVVDVAMGLADPETGSAVTSDTLFNMYSVTKPFAAAALHIQADRGLIDYDARVADYWPDYAVNGKEATTIRDVLTHRAGVPQMPEGVTPERICDWEWMTAQIAALTPLAPPGEKALYLSMTFGWIVGELVRRTDPARRSIGKFVHDEIAAPLNASDVWIGLPEAQFGRVARQIDARVPLPPQHLPPLYTASMPPQVDLVPAVFERPDVRQAEVAGVGGVFSARSCARFWAMLAEGGALDGVRILKEDTVRSFAIPRPNSGEPDPVMFGQPIPLGTGGFWLGGDQPPVAAAKHARAICHPGAGNSIGFADMQTGLAVAFTHNRLQVPSTRDEDTALIVCDAIRSQLNID